MRRYTERQLIDARRAAIKIYRETDDPIVLRDFTTILRCIEESASVGKYFDTVERFRMASRQLPLFP